MNKNLTFKDFIKIFTGCGFSLLALVVAYNLFGYFFEYISDNKEYITNPLSTMNLYISANLSKINLYLLLFQAWFFCGYFKIIYSYKMPKFINLIYYTLITLTSITVIFNFIHFRFFYFFLFIFILFIVIVSKNSYSVSEQKKQDKISAKRKGNGKQLEMDI